MDKEPVDFTAIDPGKEIQLLPHPPEGDVSFSYPEMK